MLQAVDTDTLLQGLLKLTVHPPPLAASSHSPHVTSSRPQPGQPHHYSMSKPCTQCLSQPANPGRSWCEDCYQSRCAQCKQRPANHGYSLCEPCYQQNMTGSTSVLHSPVSLSLCVRCRVSPEIAGKSICAQCMSVRSQPQLPYNQPPIQHAQHYCNHCLRQFALPGTALCYYCTHRQVQSYGSVNPPLAPSSYQHMQGPLVPVAAHSEDYTRVKGWFQMKWCPGKGSTPSVQAIFKVTSCKIDQNFQLRLAQVSKRSGWYFHGTSVRCNLLHTRHACQDTQCAVCNISRSGFDMSRVQTNIEFQRFGAGIYLAPNSSKCHDYTQGQHGVRAMLFCQVAEGQKYPTTRGDETLSKPPHGFDSVYGKKGFELNYDEIVVYRSDSVRPEYVVVYDKDGDQKIAT